MADFNVLVQSIQDTHSTLKQSAVKAINKYLTIRNWLIGLYIAEFEQEGEDRAKYGEKLLQILAESLKQDALSYRNLRLFKQFYISYPRLAGSIRDQLQDTGLALPIWQSSIAKLVKPENEDVTIW